MALTLTYIGTPTPITIGGSADVVFSAVPIGTAAADRWVLCCLWNLGDNQVPSGANIDGIASTIMYDPAASPHAPYWFLTKVPNNTTATITINYPGSQLGTGTVSVYTINGTPGLTRAGGAYFTGTGTTFNTTGISVPTVAGGVVIESFLNTKTAGAPGNVWNANSPVMTNDMVNTAISTANYMNLRSRQVASSGTEDGGSFSNNLTLSLRISALSIAEQVNVDVATTLTSFSGVSQVATVKESMPSAITTLLKKPTIAAAGTLAIPSTAATVLKKPTQEIDINVDSGNQAAIDQTLLGITQDFEAFTNHAAIDQTLPALTQDLTAEVDRVSLLGVYRGRATRVPTAGVSLASFASFSLGPASDDRNIFVVLDWDNATPRTVSSVTIGGVPADILVTTTTQTTAGGSLIAAASVPSGTTGTIDVQFSGGFDGGSFNACVINVYSITGAQRYTITDTYMDAGSSNPSKAFTVSAGGFLIVGGCSENPNDTQTGVTADDNFVFYDSQHKSFAGHSGNITTSNVTTTWTGNQWFTTAPATCAKVGVSIGPAFDDTITQTLQGITQAAAVTETLPTAIDQTLAGIVQEADVAEAFQTAIAQTLTGLSQEIDVGALSGAINQTLPGFTQEIDTTEAINATASTVLGLTTGSLDSTFIEYRNTGADSGFGGNIRTFTNINFGAANENLTIVVALNYGTAGIRVPLSMTIGGVAATRAVRSATATARCVDIWYASVPAGGIGDVRVIFGDGNNATCAVWAIRGAVDVFVGTDFNSGNSYSGFLSCRPGSVGILAACGAGNSTFTDPPTTDYLNVFQPVSTTFKSTGGDVELSSSAWFPSASASSGLTNYASAVFMPAVGGAFGLTQVLNMDVATGADIDQTLTGLTQLLNVSTINARIAQTLRGFTQNFVGNVQLPPNVIAHLIDITLPTFSQEIDIIVSPNADIDQTLLGISQEIDVFTLPNVETFIDQTFEGLTQRIDVRVSPTGAINQTFEGLTQRLNVIEIIPSSIDQTLFGITQEIDVVEIIVTQIAQTLFGITQEIDVETFAARIDQTLPGFTQEIDVIEEIVAFIDQTLLGFTQEIDVIETDPAGVLGMHIDQTLPGFTQEIDVSALRIDISVELQGIRQRIDVLAPHKHHERGPHAVAMPSKDMPIHPGELELFRRKVYARAVDAMVPPPIIARANLTTQRNPYSRPVVNRTPLGKKPS